MNMNAENYKSPIENSMLNDLFHRLNSVIPDNQNLITIKPETLVAEAIELLESRGFSQVPVVVGREVLGLFSYRSFSSAVIKHSKTSAKNKRLEILELTVEECMNSKPLYARITDEFYDLFDAIDKNDGILVGEPNKLGGMITAMDILRYLYRVASPFVLISEIELSLRALMQMAVDDETLAAGAADSLKSQYDSDRIPTRLLQMSFNDYIQIIGHGDYWPHFSPYFGANRARTRTRLEEIRDLRNIVFHFHRSVTIEDHQKLTSNRDWMLSKIRAAGARQQGEST
jgi:predicted transcriptional regulator